MRWQKWFICAFLHSHKCVCPYLLYNHVHASCYSKPKLNARWLNPIQCLSAFNHICCWNHPHRCAAWWQTHCKPTELFIAFTLHACTISLVINEPRLWPINAFFNICLILMFFGVFFVCVYFTYSDCMDCSLRYLLSNECKSDINHWFSERPDFH